MHIQSKLLQRTCVLAASSDLGQPFRPRQKSWSLGWGKNRLYRYATRVEGALPPSITVTARLDYLDYLICNVFSYKN